MFSLIKSASAMVLVASLVPLTAQARPKDLGTTGPAIHAAQPHHKGSFVASRDARSPQLADNAASFQNRGTVPNDAYAINEASVNFRDILGGESGRSAS
ncbi:MAG: hypothetical protein KGQ26_10015 [Rhodospirillales bacterium]|nr:hypothetical protein [Rhodospirillales bacterium]MDE2318186.1 hypothetical protein [Rhodospirillales bacterium]